MDADWDEITRITIPPLGGPQRLPAPATAVAFDDQQELLWIGNDAGRLTSFHGAELQRYCSLKAHVKEGPIRQLLLHERGIISLAPKGLHLTSRRGMTQWHITHPQMIDLKCMTFIQPGQLLVAGIQEMMLIIDLEKGAVISRSPSPGELHNSPQESPCLCRHRRWICPHSQSTGVRTPEILEGPCYGDQ